jgi:hypothetical protein
MQHLGAAVGHYPDLQDQRFGPKLKGMGKKKKKRMKILEGQQQTTDRSNCMLEYSTRDDEMKSGGMGKQFEISIFSNFYHCMHRTRLGRTAFMYFSSNFKNKNAFASLMRNPKLGDAKFFPNLKKKPQGLKVFLLLVSKSGDNLRANGKNGHGKENRERERSVFAGN